MEYLTNQIRQHFKGTRIDSFFYFYPLAERIQGKRKFSSSNMRKSLDLGPQTTVTSYSTHIHWSAFIFYQADKTHPKKLDFSSSKEVYSLHIFDLFKKSGCFFSKVLIFDLWFLFLPWLTKDSTSFLGILHPYLSHQKQMAMNMWSNLFF